MSVVGLVVARRAGGRSTTIPLAPPACSRHDARRTASLLRAVGRLWMSATPPSMLKSIKQRTLSAANSAGVLSLARGSAWRGRRLLILGYHGVSTDDEHEWDSELYIPPSLLRERFDTLRAGGYRVLPLADAIRQLYDGSLPSRAVSITFDDGAYDFLVRALPILEDFGYPATVYLTTYYSRFQRPVFNTMLRYLLWKARDRALRTSGLTGDSAVLPLASREDREAAFDALARACIAQRMSGSDKDGVLATVAERLDIDYFDLIRRRFLHLMAPDEVARLPRKLVDVQLHTHRHRVPADAAGFEREIADNRREIAAMTGLGAHHTAHFCYPSGVTHPSFPGWLRQLGVTSATTCFPGIASTKSDPLLLPRLIDTMNVSRLEFEGWLSGASAFLPRRPVRASAPI